MVAPRKATMPTILDLIFKPSSTHPIWVTGDPPPAIYRNDGYSLHFVLLDGVTPYVPEGTLAAQIRPTRLPKSATPGDPLAEFEVTVGGVDGNEVTIALDETQTAALPDAGFWDLQEAFVDGPPRTWFTGKVKAWGDVTRETGS